MASLTLCLLAIVMKSLILILMDSDVLPYPVSLGI
jgi:hypothetical protein